MRILEVVADGNPGGGTTNVLSLGAGLKSRFGHVVHFLCDEGSHGVGVGQELQLTTHEINFFNGRLRPGRWKKIAEIIRHIQPDIVHAHGARAGVPVARALAGMAIPMAYTVRGYHFRQKKFGIRHLAASAEKYCHTRADLNIWVSNNDREFAQKMNFVGAGDHGAVIYNGHDFDSFPKFSGEDNRKRRHIVMIGRLVFQKNPQLGLNVIRQLRDHGFTMTMVGGGDLTQEIETMISTYNLQDVVTLTGSVSREVALEVTASGEYLLLPSRWEGLPTVVSESIHYGVIPVVSNGDGLSESIKFGKAGLLIEDYDAESFVSGILDLDANEERKAALRQSGRTFISQEFELERMLSRHNDLYQRTIDQFEVR